MRADRCTHTLKHFSHSGHGGRVTGFIETQLVIFSNVSISQFRQWNTIYTNPKTPACCSCESWPCPEKPQRKHDKTSIDTLFFFWGMLAQHGEFRDERWSSGGQHWRGRGRGGQDLLLEQSWGKGSFNILMQCFHRRQSLVCSFLCNLCRDASNAIETKKHQTHHFIHSQYLAFMY